MSAVLAPSILSADFARLGEDVRAAERGGAALIHVDAMDGRFVPNLTIGPLVVRALRDVTDLPLDCHLMIEEPSRYVGDFREAGADMISVHLEADPHIHRTVQRIRELGAKAGVAINPGTPLAALDAILPEVDLVVLMTVNPGFGGQRIVTNAVERVRALRERIDRDRLDVRIEVDGGVGPGNIEEIAANGAEGADWTVHPAGDHLCRGAHQLTAARTGAAVDTRLG